jgi:DNA/RNA-binding domain of Phe-tRNA-synthetase-like protein
LSLINNFGHSFNKFKKSNSMESKKPDNVVYSDDEGFNASVLPYGTNVGAPVIRIDDVVSWKSRGLVM